MRVKDNNGFRNTLAWQSLVNIKITKDNFIVVQNNDNSIVLNDLKDVRTLLKNMWQLGIDFSNISISVLSRKAQVKKMLLNA